MMIFSMEFGSKKCGFKVLNLFQKQASGQRRASFPSS